MLELITSKSFIYIICGDFNINLNADNNNVEQFLSILSCYGAVPVIREYTRVTSTSNTCIDNIIVDNTLDYTAHSLFSGISDHKAQVLELDLRLESNNENYRTMHRLFSASAINSFCESQPLKFYQSTNQSLELT
ncbi:hypothetical protein QE152_g13661 [Popillia japonica]|uniref:Endonuclease/exonuclease/phosphatase domain-containing protein n=1 Tax=Popillia japonica TaxID=7064 RepID=A0AAW1L9A8_POPJA